MNAAQLYDKAFVDGFALGYDAAVSFVTRNHIYLASPRRGKWSDIHDWCKSQFGIGGYSWAGNTFAFESEHDLLLFKLVW